MDWMLELRQMSVFFGTRQVLHAINLEVQAGEVLALIGPNGAGKTTLLRAASGVIPYREGQVFVQGEPIEHLPPVQRARRLAVVPQARNLPLSFTVGQIVLLGRTPYLGWLGQVRPEDAARADWALERVQLQELRQRPMEELSGGEQQRVLLARALAQDTPILLMDEPTTHLDLHHQSVLLNLVRQLAREGGIAVLMALHDLNLASLYADRVALLVQGRLAAQGSPAEVLTSENLTHAFDAPVHVITHPEYGAPLVLPDGREMGKR